MERRGGSREASRGSSSPPRAESPGDSSDSKLAGAVETPPALELSPLPRQDEFQRWSVAGDWARRGLNEAAPATGGPEAQQSGRAESCLCPVSVQPCLNFSLARSKRNWGDLGLVQASFLCSPRPQMQVGERQRLRVCSLGAEQFWGPGPRVLLERTNFCLWCSLPLGLRCREGRGGGEVKLWFRTSPLDGKKIAE